MDVSLFSERFRAIQHEANLTMVEISRQCGLTRYAIYKYLNGENEITLAAAQRMGEVLKCNPSYLIGWTNDPGITVNDINMKDVYRKFLLLDSEDRTRAASYLDGLLENVKYK